MKTALIFSVLSLVFALAAPVSAQPIDIPAGSRCFSCGMTVNAGSKFAAGMIEADGKVLYFCDIGDMLSYYMEMKKKPAQVYVKDHATNSWTDARKASFVKSDKFSTPMGWAIAAFGSREDASKFGHPVDFQESMKLLGGGMKIH